MSEGLQRHVAFGRVERPKGLQGEVHVSVFNPDSDLLATLSQAGVGDDVETANVYRIENAHRQSRGWVLCFSGVQSRDAAQALCGKTLYVSREEFPALQEGEFYHCDLVGLSVFTPSGVLVGELKEIQPTGSNDVYRIQTKNGEVLWPALEGVLVEIDLKKQRIVMEPPEVSDAV